MPPTVTTGRIRRRRTPATLIAAALAAALPTAPATAIGPGLDGVLAFASQRGGDASPEIYRAALDGTSLLKLTANSDNDGAPAWSPTGSRLAFASNRDPGGNFNLEIFTMNADGSGPAPITADTDPIANTDPAWSPDGSKIAFTSSRSGNQDVWVMPAGGGAATQLTSTPGVDAHPDWSPDGTRLVFDSDRTGNSEIFTMRASDGGDVRQLTNDFRLDDDPSWSPDGTQIAFRRNDGEASIWLMKTDGSGQRDLAGAAGGQETAPAWSPQGTRVAFAESSGMTETIAVIDAGGTGFRRVLPGAPFIDRPSWQPLRPAPALSSVSPATLTAGGSAFTLTVNGTGFIRGSQVRWNGADRPTTLNPADGSTRLTAAIPATDVAAPGTGKVTVFTPGPGGGTSAELPVQIVPGDDLTITRATAAGRWRERRLTGRIALTGSLTRGAVLSAVIRTAKGRQLIRRRFSRGTGEFRLFLKLPASTLPGPLKVELSDAAPGQLRPLPTRAVTVALAPPPQGVVDRAFITTSPLGAARTRARGGVRVLYAVFRFAALPKKGRKLAVTWTLGGFRATFPATRPASRTVVAQIGSLGAGVLRRGRWSAVLRVNGAVVARARVRVG